MYVFRRLSEVREITDNWIREYNEEQLLQIARNQALMVMCLQ